MPEAEIWSQYWHYDRIASCFDGAGQSNYADEIAGGWRRFFETLNSRLGESPFVAGPRYSLADITAQVTIEFAKRAKLTSPESCTHLIGWFATVSARPSAKA